MPDPITNTQPRQTFSPLELEPLMSELPELEPSTCSTETAEVATSSPEPRTSAPLRSSEPETAPELGSGAGTASLVAKQLNRAGVLPAHFTASKGSFDAAIGGAEIPGAKVAIGALKGGVVGNLSLSVTGISVQPNAVMLGPVRISGQAAFGSAEAALGTRPADGSRGAVVKGGLSVASAEVSASYEGWSLTLGSSLGAGFEVSSGEQDADQDGHQEECLRVGAGPALIGVCLDPGPTYDEFVSGVDKLLDEAAKALNVSSPLSFHH